MKYKQFIGQENPIIKLDSLMPKPLMLRAGKKYMFICDLENKTYTVEPIWLFNFKNYIFHIKWIKWKLKQLILFLSKAWSEEITRLRNINDYGKE